MAVKGASARYREFRPKPPDVFFFGWLLTCLGGSQGSQCYSYREFRPKPDYPIMGSDAFGNGPREPARPCCFPAAGCFFLGLLTRPCGSQGSQC